MASLNVHWSKFLPVILEFEYSRYDLWNIVTNLEDSAKVASLVDVFDAAWVILLSKSFLGSKRLIIKRVWICVLSIDGSHDRVIESFIFIVDTWYLTLILGHHTCLKCAI